MAGTAPVLGVVQASGSPLLQGPGALPASTTINVPQPAPKAAASTPNTAPDVTATGGGGSTTTSDPAAAALYNQEAQSYEAQLANLDPALAQTLSDIGSGYNKAVNNQNQSLSDATSQYNTTKANDVTNEQTTRDNIATGVRDQTTALQRLLGIAGSGNSSASTVAAPYYVNQQGATQSKAAQNTFGQNEQALDTSFNTAKRNNQSALDTLAQQEFASQNQARAGNASSKAGLLQQIISALGSAGSAAGTPGAAVTSNLAPWINQLNAAVKSASGYTGQYAAPVYQTNPSIYTPPTIASYAAGITPAATTTAAPNPNAGQNITVAPTPKQQQPGSLLTQLA